MIHALAAVYCLASFAAAAPTPAPTPTPAVAVKPPAAPDSPEAFVKRLRDECARKDIAALLAMFYTEGTTEENRNFNKLTVKDLVETPIADVKLAAPREDAIYVKNGVSYRPNLKVLNTLKVSFSRKASSGFEGADLFLGSKDGTYWLTTTVSGKAAEAAAAAPAAGRPGSVEDIRGALFEYCRPEIDFLCEKVRKKTPALLACLQDNRSAATPKCRTTLDGIKPAQ